MQPKKPSERPNQDVMREFEMVVRRMLNTKPSPHKPKARAEPKKRSK